MTTEEGRASVYGFSVCKTTASTTFYIHWWELGMVSEGAYGLVLSATKLVLNRSHISHMEVGPPRERSHSQSRRRIVGNFCFPSRLRVYTKYM